VCNKNEGRTLSVGSDMKGHDAQVDNADVLCVVNLHTRGDIALLDKRANRRRDVACLELRIHDTAFIKR